MRNIYFLYFVILSFVNVKLPFIDLTSKRLSAAFLVYFAMLSIGNRIRLTYSAIFFMVFITYIVLFFTINNSAGLSYQFMAMYFSWFVALLVFIGLFSFHPNIRDLNIAVKYAAPTLFLLIVFNLVSELGVRALIPWEFRAAIKASDVSINSTFNQVVVLIVWSYYFSQFMQTSRSRWLLISVAVIMTLYVLSSLSRQNILSLVVFFFSIVVLTINLRFYFYFSAVFLVGWVALDQGGLVSKVLSRFQKSIEQVSSGDYSRLSQFYDSFRASLDQPFYGLGLGGFRDYSLSLGYYEHTAVPESTYNQVSAEGGIIFFFIFAFGLFSVGIRYFYGYMTSSDPDIKKLAGFALSYFSMLLFMMLFNEVHFSTSFSVVLLVFLYFMTGSKKNGVYSS